MKKILFLLLLSCSIMQAQTYPVNPTKFGKISLNTNGVSTSTTKINTQEADGQINYIDAINLPVSAATQIAIDGKVSDTIRDGINAIAPSENAVYDALQLKENISNKATDFTTVNNTLYPTVQAAKTYADGLVVGLLNDRGSYDASTNLYPSTGGSGTSEAIKKGNVWSISVAGTLGGVAVGVGDWIRALVDTPAQTAANWAVVEGNFGYVPENVANKSNSYTVSSTTDYPNTKALVDGLATKQNTLTNPVTGTGFVNSLALFNSSSSVTSDEILNYNSSTKKLFLDGGNIKVKPRAGDVYGETFTIVQNASGGGAFYIKNSADNTFLGGFSMNAMNDIDFSNYTNGRMLFRTNNIGRGAFLADGTFVVNSLASDGINKAIVVGGLKTDILRISTTPTTSAGAYRLLSYNQTSGTVESIPSNTYASTTNLSLGTATATTQPILNSNGTGVTLPSVTTSLAGLMPAADKVKLDGINGNPDLQSVLVEGSIATAIDSVSIQASKFIFNTEGLGAPNNIEIAGDNGGVLIESKAGGIDLYSSGDNIEIRTSGSPIYIGKDTDSSPIYLNSTSVIEVNANNLDVVSSYNIDFTAGNQISVSSTFFTYNGNQIATTDQLIPTVYTVSALPTPTTPTAYATVSDALSPTYMAAVVGGGAVVTPVFYNGTAWVCH